MRLNLKWNVLLTLITLFFLVTCSSNDAPEPFDCSTTDLDIELATKSNPSDCVTNDGSIEVSATGGTPPYQFRLGTGAFGTSSLFQNQGGGTFTITVKDANNCEKQLTNITLTTPGGPVASASTLSHQTNCTSPNGSITANVTGGAEPYQYKIGNGSFGGSATFSNLKAGLYTITIMDDNGCTITRNETINSNTGVSYLNDIKPILETNCIKSGCHNGDNGAERNWSVLSNVQAKAQGIKTRTGNKSMPKDIAPTGLPQNEIDLIACWVDEGAQNN
ncbi:MAG: SprB repeat-containing protein [Flammeovirgaceae bacterium]|nr:SprB repeat-containing protein [Flammeovirgaceae bacterium]